MRCVGEELLLLALQLALGRHVVEREDRSASSAVFRDDRHSASLSNALGSIWMPDPEFGIDDDITLPRGARQGELLGCVRPPVRREHLVAFGAQCERYP